MKPTIAQSLVGSPPGTALKWPTLEDLWLSFRSLTDRQIDSIVKNLAKKRKKEKEDPLIHCKSCGHTITTVDNVISVAGQHRHTFRNPAGIVYSIGCFSKAKGCFDMGEPTLEFTWFPGYSWCYSVCGKCFTHIGWFYRSGDSTFYGLILNRLEGGR